MHQLRIMYSTNGVWCASGYATQAKAIAYGLLKAGFPIAHSAFFGLQGAPIEIDGLKIYPQFGDMWGVQAMKAHGEDFKSDVSMSYQDVWPMDHNLVRDVKRWIAHVPIDTEPISPAILERLTLAWKIVSISQFGHDMLKKAGFASTLIKCGVDLDLFKKKDKIKCRETFSLPQDEFIFGMVAANKDNPPRKSFQEVLEAFKRFHDNHPKSKLFILTQHMDNPQGFPIKQFSKDIGIENHILFLDPYKVSIHFNLKETALFYNAIDCLLSPSTSEGFGLPIIEAQACECPVIVQDYSAMPEHVDHGKTGFICKTAYKRYMQILAYWAIPDVKDLYKQMEAVFTTDRSLMGRNARAKMEKEYDMKDKLSQWIDFFSKIETDIYPTPLTK